MRRLGLKKKDMLTDNDMEKFILMYAIPFLIVFVPLFINEYRLWYLGKIDDKSLTNSLAMLIVSLIGFMSIQAIMTIFL